MQIKKQKGPSLRSKQVTFISKYHKLIPILPPPGKCETKMHHR